MLEYDTDVAYDCITVAYTSDYEISFPSCINNESADRYKIKCTAVDIKGIRSDEYDLYFDLYENSDVVFGDNYASYADYDSYDTEIHISQNDDDFII